MTALKLSTPGFTREFIDKLALSEPIVKQFLTFHIRDGLTYEQALIGMVCSLVQCNNQLLNEEETRFLLSAPPVIIQVSDEGQLERLVATLKELRAK